VDQIDQALMQRVQDIDQELQETEIVQYPVISWWNGKPDLKGITQGVQYTGGWFADKRKFQVEELPGWTAVERVFTEGSSEGFARRDLTVAMLCKRQRWELGDKKEPRSYYPWNKFDEARADAEATGRKFTGRTQVLVVIRDMPSLGATVLTLHGNMGKAFTTGLKGAAVLPQFKTKVLDFANTLAKSKFLPLAFWITIGPQRDSKGNPIFCEVGKKTTSKVTLPDAVELSVVDKLTKAQLAAMLVSQEELIEFQNYRRDAEDWLHAFDTVQVQVAPDTNEAGDNELQDIGEEEIPF
jgi:hypothetical protein